MNYPLFYPTITNARHQIYNTAKESRCKRLYFSKQGNVQAQLIYNTYAKGDGVKKDETKLSIGSTNQQEVEIPMAKYYMGVSFLPRERS